MQNAAFSSSVTGHKKPVGEMERECDHDAIFGAANFFSTNSGLAGTQPSVQVCGK